MLDDPHGPPSVERRRGRPSTLDAGGASLASVLSLVRSGAATTRLDLKRASELSRAAVTDRLATLERLQLIAAGDLGPAVRGRAPRHLRFRLEAGDLLAAHIGRASLALALADLNGQLLAEHHEAADFAAGPEAAFERLIALLLWMLEDRGGRFRIWGAAVALPEIALMSANESGAFDVRPDVLRAWRSFDFASRLPASIGSPAWTRSATQLMTLGELKAGAGRGAGDMLCVRIEGSITAAIVSDGRVHAGANQLAGLIGHTPTGEGGDLICPCGARGCLDAVASGHAVARDANAAARQGRSPYLSDMLDRLGAVGPNEVAHGAQLGDPFCAELLGRSGRLIGESLAPLVNLVNPAAVVLAGPLAFSSEILLASVRELIYRRSHPLATRDLRIVRSELGGSAELVGAACLASDEIFAADNAREWIPHGSPRLRPSFLAALAQARAGRNGPPTKPASVRAPPSAPP